MATVGGGALHDGTPIEATQDALFGGSVVLFQPPRGSGYRTNVDALLLAAFAASPLLVPGVAALAGQGGQGRLVPQAPSRPRPAPVAFDLGAGVGAVGLALLRFGAARRVVFVEIDELAAAMARRNLDANGWTDRGEIVRGDVADVGRARQGEASLVVCNPPYIAPGRGRVSAAEARARSGEIDGFVEAARQLAGQRARVCFVYPAAELGALHTALTSEGLHPKRVRFVHGTPAAPARIVLVEARAGRPGGLHVMPPLVERSARGYTPEMETLLARG
jgi:tRNA1Val (adenine37-N6)-methyltransferase